MRYRFLHLPEHTALRRVAQVAALLLVTGTLLTALPRTQLNAQSKAGVTASSAASEEIAAGKTAFAARQTSKALQHFEAALQLEPRNAEALWRASGSGVDLAEGETDGKKRDAMYAKYTAYARTAVEINPDGAEENFTLARAIGRMALTVGARERVKFGTEVRAHALKALAADAKHPGALHVMGVWNAEIMRLNGFIRLIAKTLLGGAVFSTASWASAEKYLTEAVAIDPTRTVHRLDLARVYHDTGRDAEARAAYEAAIKCPLVDANDEMYKQTAAAELRALK